MEDQADDDDSLIETSVMTPINFDGIGPIDFRDGVVYITLWARQQKTDGSGLERVVVVKAVTNKIVLQTSIFALTKALARTKLFGLAGKARREGH